MGRVASIVLPGAMVVGDLAMTNLSILAAYRIRFQTSLLPQAQEFHQLSDYTGLAVLNSVLFLLFLAAQ
ncbi:MAG TPA: hypothetical protein VJO15_00590, partial [Dehalococcoidia bacterium]|nr:hypothetical protein [Dehalococcoidia bacterium]